VILLRAGAETNVYVRSSHAAHVATCVSHQERTCTCVPAKCQGSAQVSGGLHSLQPMQSGRSLRVRRLRSEGQSGSTSFRNPRAERNCARDSR
jgi:hypothetical protein